MTSLAKLGDHGRYRVRARLNAGGSYGLSLMPFLICNLDLLHASSVTTSALETVKILGRNPSGSEILATKQYLCVPAFHAGLIAQRDSTEDVSRGRKDAGAWNKARSHAVAIIANALRLFEDPALDAAQDLALGTAAVEILRSVDDDEATFLLGRLLMLLTSRSKSGRKESDGKLMEPYVKRFVEVDDGVELLQKVRRFVFLHRITPWSFLTAWSYFYSTSRSTRMMQG